MYKTRISTVGLGTALMFIALAVGVAMVQAKDNVSKLKGTYAFSGEAGCLVSRGGFDSNFNAIPLAGPVSGIFPTSFSVEGTATFDGNGSGVRSGTSTAIHITGPANTTSGASVQTFSAPFTYTIDDDGTVHTQTSAPVTGTVVKGDRAGQTFTIDTIPLTGHISKDGKTVTLSSTDAVVETQQFSNGDTHPRICHRERVLIEI